MVNDILGISFIGHHRIAWLVGVEYAKRRQGDHMSHIIGNAIAVMIFVLIYEIIKQSNWKAKMTDRTKAWILLAVPVVIFVVMILTCSQ